MSRYLKKTSFPLTLALLLLLAAVIFAFRGEAQQPKVTRTAPAKSDKPFFGTAVGFAESDALRDLPDLATLTDSEQADGGSDVPSHEVNEFNTVQPKAGKVISSKIISFDAALPGKPEGPLAVSSVGAPIANFDGMDDLVNVGF